MDGVGGVGIEAFEVILAGAVFVVVALDAGDVHVADDFETFLGVGVVADHVAEADNVRGILGADVLQHNLEGLHVAVNVCDDGVFHCSADDFKSMKFIFRNAPIYMFVPNKSSKTCVPDGGVESLQFRARALGDQFDAAVRQIADNASDFKSGGHGFGGVTEPDALHAAGIKNPHAAPAGDWLAFAARRDEAKAGRRMQCFLTVVQKKMCFNDFI